MRHLAIRHQAAGPAPHASPLVGTFVTVIVLALSSVAVGQNRQQDWWQGTYLQSSTDPGLWNQPFPSPRSSGTLSEELFPPPSSGDPWKPRTLQAPYRDAAVRPAQALERDWLPVPSHAHAPVEQAWCHQVLPDGLIYRSYLAGVKEPRFAGQWVHDVDHGWLWDITLGGRVGILRYGTTSVDHPEGWQLDIEGAGMPRLDLEQRDRDLIASDFRFGIPLTYGRGSYQTKFGYYHLSSHLGDEYMVRHNTLERRNLLP